MGSSRRPLRETCHRRHRGHNHPSGPHPHSDDRNVTRRLKSAGELLGIPVLDHLIFSDVTFHSMLEEDEF